VDSDELEAIKRERDAAVEAIVNSDANKKLVVAGSGTGKTYTFREALERCGDKGRALTFIRNLVADLREDLGDSVRANLDESRPGTRFQARRQLLGAEPEKSLVSDRYRACAPPRDIPAGPRATILA
jgi:hypothetical protein